MTVVVLFELTIVLCIQKPDMFIKPLEDQHVKDGKDKIARFECVFSKSGIKAKWFKGRTELFMGKKYNMTSTGDLHVLEIREPHVDDAAQYKCTCLDKSTMAMLEVAYPDPVYKFTKPLQKKYEQYTHKELVLECSVNHSKAQVKWFKNGTQIDTNDKHTTYHIDRDTFGKHFLKIRDCRIEDNAEFSCKIVNNEEKTSTKVIITDRMFIFVKPLMSLRATEGETITLECEVDDRDADVKWYKDGKEVVPIPKKLDIVSEGRKRKIVIKKAKVTDEAQYRCETNGDKTECETLVEPSNKFRKKLSDKTVIERDELVLDIEMLEKRAPLRWYKNGEEIKPSDR